MKKVILALLLLVLLLNAACEEAGPPDSSAALPPGEPSFPVFQGKWVIDTTGKVSKEAIEGSSTRLQKLRDDGVAEVLVTVINGVQLPEAYATKLGRNLKLGNKETDNGVVILIRPDGGEGEHIVYSVGRGLPAFTSAKATEALQDASSLANKGDISGAVTSATERLDQVLRSLYQPRPETVPTPTEEEKEDDGLTPGQQKAVITTILVVCGIWTLMGLVFMIFDFEFGVEWLFLGLRLLLLLATLGKAGGGSTGGSGKFGGRSRKL